MKKLKWGILVTFITLFLLPTAVFAANTNELAGVVLASPGETVSYDIKIKTTDTAVKYTTTLAYDSTVLELVSIENQSGWKGTNSIGNSPRDLSFTHTGTSGESTIATIKFKIKAGTGKSSFTISMSTSNITTLVKNDEDVESPVINPVSAITKTVSIKSTDNSLKDLKVNNKAVTNFSPMTYSYVMQVEGEVTSVALVAALNDTNASFVKDFGPRTVDIAYGENELLIKVKSESGEEITYKIMVTRIDNREKNNYLKSIIINAGKVKINFSKDITDYALNTYKLDALEIETQAEDKKSTVTVVKPDAIVIGNNIVTITVVSESKEERIYTLTINNTDKEVDTTLKNLTIEGYEINFNKETLGYEIRYNSKYKDGLKIYATTTTLTKDGVQIDDALLDKTNKNIKPGSIIEIRVYASDDIETVYTITVLKDNRLNFFFVIGMILIVVLAIVLVLIIRSKKKLNEATKKHEEAIKKEEEIQKTKEVVLNQRNEE